MDFGNKIPEKSINSISGVTGLLVFDRKRINGRPKSGQGACKNKEVGGVLLGTLVLSQ